MFKGQCTWAKVCKCMNQITSVQSRAIIGFTLTLQLFNICSLYFDVEFKDCVYFDNVSVCNVECSILSCVYHDYYCKKGQEPYVTLWVLWVLMQRFLV